MKKSMEKLLNILYKYNIFLLYYYYSLINNYINYQFLIRNNPYSAILLINRISV